jgi:hypothetical protein
MEDTPTTTSPLTISLSELDLAPDWVSQLGDQPAGQVIWGHVAERGGARNRDGHGGRGGDRPREARRPDRGGPRPPRADERPRAPGGPRPDRGPRREAPPRHDHARGGDRRGGRGERGDRRDRSDRGDDRFRRASEAPAYTPPTPGWIGVVLPEPAGVENLTLQIKSTGRSYSVFALAHLFLAHNERIRVRFEPRGATPVPPLILCAVDGSLWLTRDEARRHFAKAGMLSHFFHEEKITVDPPKGIFTAIAVCGLSGTVLGPPNFHAYQRAVVQLHQDRFRNMPLERYKSRIRIERDEEAVKKWLEAQSTQTRYTLREGGENVPTFATREEAVAYVLEHHEADLFAEAPSAIVPGAMSPSLLSPGLASHLRETIEHQRRFPLELVQELCRQFETHGLRFFKENKKETYVARSRPRPLEASTAVSDRVKRIVQFIREHAKSTYREVVIGLVPQAVGVVAPRPAAAAAAPSAEPAAAAAPVEQPDGPTAEESAVPATSDDATSSAEPLKAEAAAASPSESEPTEPSAADREGIAILQDLRWLIREGYVTEFADGQLRVVERQERPIVLAQPKRLRLPSRAFTLWTRPFLPTRLQPGIRLPGRGFTLWTRAATPIEGTAAALNPS